MIRFQILAALLLSGCGYAPDYVSAAGVAYYLGGALWTAAQIEAQEQAYLATLDLPAPLVERVTRAASVLVFPEAWLCTARDGYCNGEQVNASLWVRDMGCPFNSAVTHELGHLLHAAANGGDPDGPHADPAFDWPATDRAAGACSDFRFQ